MDRFGPDSSAALAIERVLTPGISHYRVMKLALDATPAQIKKAYRALSLELHPDRNQARGADEVFKRLGLAFSVLHDKSARATYDNRGGAWAQEGLH